MKKKPTIAIDGYSSTGKSSISKNIARKLGLIHIDTGALYRAITLYALENTADSEGNINLEKLFLLLPNVNVALLMENEEMIIYLNGENVQQKIRENTVANMVSFIAKQKEVRDFLLETQREIAENGGVIMDGRDIGTVVLPHADYKFFLTASIQERSKRRFLELKAMGIETSLIEVKENLQKRDKTDSERAISPLKKAENAILIDNSDLTKQETEDTILRNIETF